MAATPLTRTEESGELYRRPPNVEAQLAELCKKSLPEQLACARITDEASPLHVKDECLAYLLQTAASGDDLEQYNALAGALFKRVVRRVEGQLRTLGVPEDDVADLHQEVMMQMMTALAEGQRGEFYQVKFGLALRRDLLNIYDGYLRRSTDDMSLDAATEQNEEDGCGGGTLGESFASGEDVATDVECRLLEKEAISAIKNPKHREAFVLRYHGWPIESKDPEEGTLSQLYDRTPKMIRSWLRTAERQVAEWRATKRL